MNFQFGRNSFGRPMILCI